MSTLKVLAVVAAVGICAVAFADDLNPPPWRTNPPGQGSTTFQQWEFNTNANPAAPDVVHNNFGAPVANIHGDFPYTVWLANDNGHNGVWRFEDWISLDVPNDPIQHPYKEIWIQITYSAGAGHDPQLFTEPPESNVETVNKVQLDQFYWHGTYKITIIPNPQAETIFIEPRDCTLYVDEIVLDTISIPEPASLFLLAVSSLLLRRR